MSEFRRRLMTQVASDPNALPADFQQVEFIGSSGTQFFTIDPFDYNGCVIEFKVRFKTIVKGRDKNSFGAIKGNSRLEQGVGWMASAFSANYGAVGFRVGTNFDVGTATPSPDTLAHTWRYDPSGIYFDDVKIDQNYAYIGSKDDWGIFDQPLSVRFFGTDRLPTSERISDVEFYYWECIKDSIVKIRLIPCYNKITGVIGMYDVVNKKFYINEGIGIFVKGADI